MSIHKYILWLFLIILFSIAFLQTCKKNTTPVENYLFPEAEKQNINVDQLAKAFDNAAQIE